MAAPAYEVELDAPKDLKALLTQHLDLVRYRSRDDLNDDQVQFMQATVAAQVQKLLATEGYFSPRTTVQGETRNGLRHVAVRVEPGPRTTIDTVAIRVFGPAVEASAAQVKRVRQPDTPAPGDPFRQESWAALKQSGLRKLQARRYPAAHIEHSEANVDTQAQRADLAIDYDSGPRFTLGPLAVTGLRRYPGFIVEHLNPLQEGEDYSAERLLAFQRLLLRTPYFSNAVISVDPDPDKAELAPVKVAISEFPTQRLRTGVGFTTDTGAHIEGRYWHNDLLHRAWALDTQLKLEQERQVGALGLALPPDAGGYVNSFQSSIERTTLEGVDLQSRRIGLRRANETEPRDRIYLLAYYRDKLATTSGAQVPTDIVVQPGTSQALLIGTEQTVRRVDNPRFPRRGYIATIHAGVALKGLLTDQTFVRGYGQWRQYQPIGKRDTVILRGELGAVVSRGDSVAIPASLLFRAGGTDSVRGYGFQAIGNVRNGTVYPTRYLATGSVEYQHWLTESWGAAVFYDVGSAADRLGSGEWFHAVGVGARWRSPVGSVNVDLAYGFQSRQIQPHLSLGVAF